MDQKKPIHKNVWLLGLVSLLNDISSEIIAPILPILIKNLGGSGVSIGLISGVRDGLTRLLKLVFGALSDHHNKRKPFVVAGYFISACFKGILLFAQSWHHILLFVGLERIGKGIRTSPRDVILAQSTPKSIAKSLGIVRSFDNIGASIGSIIIFLLLWLYKFDLKLIVALATGIALTALIPLFFVEEPKPQSADEPHEWGPLPATVKRFAFINSIFHFGAISYMFLTLRVHDFSSIFSPVQNALLMYTTFNLIHALCAAPLGTIIDALNQRVCVISGYILYGLVMMGFWLAKTPPQFWILFMAYGVALALTDTSQRAFAITLSPTRRQGTSVGMVYASMGIAQITGGALCGCIWEYGAHEYIFILSIAAATVSALLLTFFSAPSPARAQ
jgi:MFS family permease